MTEDEIKQIVRKEFAELIHDSKLTDSDILVKQDKPISKSEIVQEGITSLTMLRKKIGDYFVLLAKSGKKVVKIILTALGVWSVAQFGTMLLFEKSLPDAQQLAQRVHNAAENILESRTLNVSNEAETFIVVSDQWKKYSREDYRTTAYNILSGDNPFQNLYDTTVNEFVTSDLYPCSSVPVQDASNSSANPSDFTVKTT